MDVQTVTLSDSNDWSNTVTVRNPVSASLSGPSYRYVYRWEEVSGVDGYTSAQTAEGNITTITNTHTPETVSVTVKKVWNDYENTAGLRPNQVTVVLKADEEKVGDYTISQTDGWKLEVNNLQKNKNGTPISYTWEEVSVPEGYTPHISKEGYQSTITNTYIPKYVITTDIDYGNITETETDIPYGENRIITWTPDEGRYIKAVMIDGKEIPVTESYSFTNITADHDVVVTTLPYHRITTGIDHGIITERIEKIKDMERKVVTWTPETGYYVTKVIINGETIYEGTQTSGYPTEHEFKDITKDYNIIVETKKIPNLIITKKADKKIYNVDDFVTYTITARQTIEGAVATNVVITDKDFTKGLELNIDTVSCSINNAEIKTSDTGFKVLLDKLGYDEEAVITVQGKVNKDTLESSDIKNIASIRSDQTEEKTDDADINIKYSIVTAVENGTITESLFDIVLGENRTITYQPDEGYYLLEVKVDGETVDTENFADSYAFSDIKDNHLIEAKYAPYYKVTGQIDNGTITKNKTNIKAGENHTVTWTPETGYYVAKVIINGETIYEGTQTSGYPTEHEFTDIQGDWDVIIKTEPIPEETTVIETTTPEETSTKEQAEIDIPISTYQETTTEGEDISNAPLPAQEARNAAPKTGGNAINILAILCMIALIPGFAVTLYKKKKIKNVKENNNGRENF